MTETANMTAYLTLVSLVAASLSTVALGIYTEALTSLLRLEARALRRHATAICRLGRTRARRDIIAAADAIVAISLHVGVAGVLAPLFLVVAPVAIAVGAFIFSASLIAVPGA